MGQLQKYEALQHNRLQLELGTIFSHINPLIIVLIGENRVETRYENVTEKK